VGVVFCFICCLILDVNCLLRLCVAIPQLAHRIVTFYCHTSLTYSTHMRVASLPCGRLLSFHRHANAASF
jgi:hypothetical protein